MVTWMRHTPCAGIARPPPSFVCLRFVEAQRYRGAQVGSTRLSSRWSCAISRLAARATRPLFPTKVAIACASLTGIVWLRGGAALRAVNRYQRLANSSVARTAAAGDTRIPHDVTLFTARSTFPAFNGWKMTILLEELQAAGKFPNGFEVRELNLDKKEHKEDWFLAINPNGRIPALVDHRYADYAVFESGAIMQYLGEVYGDGFLLPADKGKRYDVLQWLFFQCAGVGPIQGQAHAFLRYVPEELPYAIERFTNETRRLYEVLDRRLSVAEYLAGEEYSIADIALYPWIAYHPWAGQDISDLPHLHRWCQLVGARPAVQRGLIYNPKDLSELIANASHVRRTVAATTLDRAKGESTS